MTNALSNTNMSIRNTPLSLVGQIKPIQSIQSSESEAIKNLSTADNKCALRVTVSQYLSQVSFEILIRDIGIEYEAVRRRKGTNKAFITFTSDMFKNDACVKLTELINQHDSPIKKFTDSEYTKESNKRKRVRLNALERFENKKLCGNEKNAPETTCRDVAEVVTPWANIAYHQQLEMKRVSVLDSLSAVLSLLRKDYKRESSRYPDLDIKGVKRDISNVLLFSPSSGENAIQKFTSEKLDDEDREKTLKINNARVMCPLETIIGWTSEGIINYRNKLEFTVGYSIDDEPTVGYMCGRHTKGWGIIGSGSAVSNAPKVARCIAAEFEVIVKDSGFEPYRQTSSEAVTKGVWRRLIVRVAEQSKHVMLCFIISESHLDAKQSADIRSLLVARLPTDFVAGYTISTIACARYDEYANAFPSDIQYELLRGNGFIIETLCGFDFQVQPNSFFQVNSVGAEKLYNLISQFISEDAADGAVLADICCGTGSIGMTLSKRFDTIVGFELVAAAVEDARRNAIRNALQSRCEFIVGKAEETLPQYMEHSTHSKIVAVVDPPRPGLHSAVIRALRACSAIKTIVYVSCNPKSMAVDVAALLRPERGSARPGLPFKPVKAALIDMFPNTSHCEIVVLLQR